VRDDSRFFTVYEDDHLTGVLPLHRLHGRLGSPTNSHTPMFGFLATTETAMEHLAQALFFQKPRRIDLEAARIGWQFFVLVRPSNDQTSSPAFIDSFVTRLSAQALKSSRQVGRR
jgi:hypothetical protein